jgi:hypothetical protein
MILRSEWEMLQILVLHTHLQYAFFSCLCVGILCVCLCVRCILTCYVFINRRAHKKKIPIYTCCYMVRLTSCLMIARSKPLATGGKEVSFGEEAHNLLQTKRRLNAVMCMCA